MEIRKYQSSDLKVICELFYETINTINRYDYNNDQIKVWSNRSNFLLTQDDFFNSMYTLVAVSYTHLDVYKRQGVLKEDF